MVLSIVFSDETNEIFYGCVGGSFELNVHGHSLKYFEYILQLRYFFIVSGRGAIDCEVQFDMILVMWQLLISALVYLFIDSTGPQQRLIMMHHQYIICGLTNIHLKTVRDMEYFAK